MPLVIGALKRLEMVRTMPELREKLWENVHALQNGLRENNFDIGQTTACVTPVWLHGTVGEAGALVQDMRETYDVFCSVVLYPMIPKGTIILRLIPTAAHSLEDVKYTIDAFSEVRKKLEDKVYLEKGVEITTD